MRSARTSPRTSASPRAPITARFKPLVRVGILREDERGERRVALVPHSVAQLVERGVEVMVETGAGLASGHTDDAYRDAGATVSDRSEVGRAEVVVGVRGTNASHGHDLGPDSGPALAVPAGAVHIALFDPVWNPATATWLAANGVSALSLELVPRITRAQDIDVLSSMATIAGYEAVLLAASRLPKLFPLLMTAAGTLAPARVLVLGAGVAGLQAIATARRLGAVVEGYDVRPAAAEQIRSLGARSVEPTAEAGTDNHRPVSGSDDHDGGEAETAIGVEDAGGYATVQSTEAEARQRRLLTPHVAGADVVITTAAVPGKVSPQLVSREMVEAMQPGSVIVDLAAERGGNTAVTVADEVVMIGAVTVLGPTDLASRAAHHASQMFSNNVARLLDQLLVDDSPTVNLDPDHDVIGPMLVSHQGAVVHPQVQAALETLGTDSGTVVSDSSTNGNDRNSVDDGRSATERSS